MVRETWPHGCFSRASCARRFVLETCQVTPPVWLGMRVRNKCCGCRMRAVGCELVMEEGRGGGRPPLEKALSLGRPVILGSFRGEGGPQRVVGVEAYSSPEMFFFGDGCPFLQFPIPIPPPSPFPSRRVGTEHPAHFCYVLIGRDSISRGTCFPVVFPLFINNSTSPRVPRRWMPW